MSRKDDRWYGELPSGIIKNPKLHIAGDDFDINDAVYLEGDTVYPMYDESHALYGFVACRGVKGKKVLIAGPVKKEGESSV